MPQLGEIAKGKLLGFKSCGQNRYIWLACPDCGKERWVMLCRHKKGIVRCRVCSARKRGREKKASRAYVGQNNPQWCGGRHKTLAGYVRVFINPDSPYYPMAKKLKSRVSNDVSEHRLVMAEYLGRCLYPWEIVHHKNGVKDDNRIVNLYIVNKKSHERNTRLKILEQEVRLLQCQVKLLTSRLNQATIGLPVSLLREE